MFIDTHCHLQFPEYNEDRVSVIANAKETGVGVIICVGANLETSRQAVQLAKEEDGVYATVGIHPEEVGELGELSKLAGLTKNKRVIAIGECGLDYHYATAGKDLQRRLFELQLKIAEEVGLPVVIHNREAQDDILQLIKPFKIRGVFHCFSGEVAFLEEVIKRGFYIGFDGNITYKNAENLRELVKAAPLERILGETDAPYLSPEPYRGKRNVPARVVEVVKIISQIKNVELSIVENQIEKNTRELFEI